MSEGEKAVVLQYSKLSEQQVTSIEHVKKTVAVAYDAICVAENLFGLLDDFSIAKERLKEASMWAVRGIANPE